MSNKANWPDSKGLKKVLDEKTFYLGRSCDMTNGKGWFCQIHCHHTFDYGFGFHKTNKFIAVRMALVELKKDGYFTRLIAYKEVDERINNRRLRS